MSKEPTDDRRYTEKEIQVILKCAGELQAARTENAPGMLGGTTLAQLQQAAAEIGIDADLIAHAAQNLPLSQTEGQASGLLGGPWKVDSDQLVPGVVTEETWPFVVDDMRAATGRVGFPKAVGKGFEWLSLQPDAIHVTFTPTGAKTRVRVTARFGGWSGLFYILPAMLALILTILLSTAFGKSDAMSPALFLTLLVGLPGMTLVGGRMAFKRFCAQRRQQTYHLIDRLKQAIAQPSPQTIVAEPEVVETASVPPVISTALPPATEEPLLNVQRLQN